MANRNNSGRTKKTHSFKPYNTSNSFVKRITAKVSEILPQPTSWVSRLFSPASKLNTRGHEEMDDDDDDEEERQPPPSKRLCFSPPETNDYSHQNNVNRLGDLGRGSGEISPILSSRTEEDRAVPGPSGLHLRRFVASTPAVRQPSPSKVNLREKARDDASDESETTSGCSSLVPGTERPHPRQEQLSTPTAASPNIPSTSSMRRLSTNTLKATSLLNRTSSMNLSTSSQPSFDTYVFNNPLNRSGIRRRSIADESCFYPGQTTFGGSSSRLTAPIDQPRVVCVKASPTKQLQQDTIGTSALRILKALEQFSTPVLDAKRIPLRKDSVNNERKRKAPQPYEELIYPSMPDLLRLKRREQQREQRKKEQSDQASSSTSQAGTSSTSSAKASPFPTPSTSSVHHVSIPSEAAKYTFRAENPKERHIGSIKGRSKDEDLETERVPAVNLPNVKLQLSTLPKFDINVTKPQEKGVTQHQSSSTPSNPPPFKFSEPEIPKLQALKPCLPVNTFKFSEPLEPLKLNKKSSETPPIPKTGAKFPTPQLQMKNPSPNLKLKRKTSETGAETQSKLKFEIKPASEMKNASVMEVLSKKPSIEGDWTCTGCNSKSSNENSKCRSCGKAKLMLTTEISASPVGLWDCKKCSLKNPSSETKCKSCGMDNHENPTPTTFKGFEGFKKPKDSWECSSCLVTNKNILNSCAACSTPKSGKSSAGSKNTIDSPITKPFETKFNDVGSKPAASSTSTLFNSIKTPEGSWECGTCLVRNKKDDSKCVACSTSKPGSSAPSEKAKPAFSFGIPPSSTTETKPFNALASSGNQSQFSFGIPSENKTVSSSSPKPVAEKKSETVIPADSSTSVSSTVAPKPSPLVNSFKKPQGSWECNTCLVQNKPDTTTCVACSTLKPGATPVEKPKPTFSFGIPPTSTSTTNSNSIPFGASTDDKSSNVNSKPQFTFGNSSIDKKTPSSTLFGFPPNDSKPANELKPFTFLNSDQPKDKETVKAPMTNLFTFGNTNKETKSEEMNDESDDKPAKKRVSFGNPLTFEKKLSNDTNTSSFGNLVNNKTNEISSSSNFVFTPKFTPIENNTNLKKEAAPASNALFSFGSSAPPASKPNDIIPSSEPAKPLPFGSVNSDKPAPTSTELPNSNSIFGGNASSGGFKVIDTNENKPFAFMANNQAPPNQQQSGGFSFTPPTAPAPEFGSQANQIAPNPTPSLFGQQQVQPLFSQPQEQKPFVFNAPVQQQQAPVFTFTAAPAPAQGGLGTQGFGFTAPSAPKFDPNIKPSFNFTGGATPSFSATTNSLDVTGGDTKRKVRKAIRRTTQHR